MNLKIRAAETKDYGTILELVREAFSSTERGGQPEVNIVQSTWLLDASLPELELVAVDGDRVVGHILGARGQLEEHDVVGVAPLSVAPCHQRQGIGSSLMAELLRRAEAVHWPLVALLGDPGYYGPLGFEPASQYGIFYRQAGVHDPNFQLHRLSSFQRSLRGEFRFCWELPVD